MSKRKKILLLSDHPLVPSGVGSQAKYLIEQLLGTGKYKFFCLGGAIKHPDYRLQKVAPEKFGDGNWTIMPVDGHGSKEILREVLKKEKPDAVMIFTDPRFFYWLWEIEDEVRAQCPLLYWHVWDNDPLPDFNRMFYESTDQIIALSLKTYGILQGLEYDKERFCYIPHALPDELFKPLHQEDIEEHKKKYFGPYADREFICFWNNRNARRKMTGDVIDSFNRFANLVGRKKVGLLMHTQANDPEGQDIHALIKNLKADDIVFISESRVSPEQLNMFYNCADATINISSNEGFGLGTLESLFSGTPIIVHMTGGLQFQIGDWWKDLKDFSDQDKLAAISKKRWNDKLTEWWGVPVFPAVRNCVGSQQVPYIFDDRANNDDVAKALKKLFDLGKKKRNEIGLKAREWVRKEFSLKRLTDDFDAVIEKTINRRHETRKRINVADV